MTLSDELRATLNRAIYAESELHRALEYGCDIPNAVLDRILAALSERKETGEVEGLVERAALETLDVFAEFLDYHKGGATATLEQKARTADSLRRTIRDALQSQAATIASLRQRVEELEKS